METIKVVIADDHKIFRNGLKLLLKKQQEIEVCAEAGDGKEAVEKVLSTTSDVVIMDIQMPVLDGISACREIREAYPYVAVIALTTFNDNHYIVDMMHAGATGYLMKNTNWQELQKAIRTVYEGGMYFTPEISKKLNSLKRERRLLPGRITPAIRFTEKELRIIELICKQLTSKEIASNMGFSIRTVESYRKKIQEKIGAKNMAGIVIYALQHNFFDL